MDLSLTFDKLLSFPEDFIKASNKYCDLTEPLSARECNKYKLKELRSTIDKQIQLFKDTKYLYKYPNEIYYVPITPNYQPKEVMMPRKLSSKQEDKIDPIVNRQIWATHLYYSFMESLSTKLTRQECVYFIESYFKKHSEDDIASKLSICKDTLQRVKKSCLIKVYIEVNALEDYYEEEW